MRNATKLSIVLFAQRIEMPTDWDRGWRGWVLVLGFERVPCCVCDSVTRVLAHTWPRSMPCDPRTLTSQCDQFDSLPVPVPVSGFAFVYVVVFAFVAPERYVKLMVYLCWIVRRIDWTRLCLPWNHKPRVYMAVIRALRKCLKISQGIRWTKGAF